MYINLHDLSVRKKIAVNTRFLIKDKLEGIGLFTYESLKRITANNPYIDFYFLFDRAFDKEFVFGNNVTPVVLHPQARHPLLWWWWFEVSVAGWLNKNKPDLFLSTDGFGCLNSSVSQVVVLHDLAYEHFAEHVPLLTRKYYQHYIPRYVKKAARTATVSEYSKQDIIKHYGIAAGNIDVVYNGAKEVYVPVIDSVKTAVKQRVSGGNDYFVYVGSVHPRKNVARLLLAFDRFKSETNSDLKLVMVGRKAWDFADVDAAYSGMKFKNDVIWLGHVAPEALGEIVASAYAMVYVSLFEGFGIPIVEAMSCDVPVITSNVTSMPEAAGDAALLVNPLSVDEIAHAMKQMAGNESLRNILIGKGKLQIKKFTWDLTAGKLWSCCQKVLDI